MEIFLLFTFVPPLADDLTVQMNKKIKNFINYFLGPLLFVWLGYAIYRQIIKQPQLEESWFHIRQSFQCGWREIQI